MDRAETAAAGEAGGTTAVPATQRSLAYQGFRQQIIDARIRPGQFVSQRELMALLGMSLAAVREMVPRLEAAGLIRAVPKRGLQVAPVDMKLIRNAWQVRAMVEREAMLHFARTATPAVLQEQIAAHDAILARALAPQADASLEKDAQAVDWGLHDMMVDAIGNEILSEIYRVNSLHVRLIRFDAEALRPMQVLPAMREHLAILHALADGRPDEALDRMMAHIESSKRRVIEVMTQGAGQRPA